MGKNYLMHTGGTSRYLYFSGLNRLYLASDSLLQCQLQQSLDISTFPSGRYYNDYASCFNSNFMRHAGAIQVRNYYLEIKGLLIGSRLLSQYKQMSQVFLFPTRDSTELFNRFRISCSLPSLMQPSLSKQAESSGSFGFYFNLAATQLGNPSLLNCLKLSIQFAY